MLRNPRPKIKFVCSICHQKKKASFKKKALKENTTLKNITTFQVVAAKIWKARSIATKMLEEKVSIMLFPVDVRKRVVPELPNGFAGN